MALQFRRGTAADVTSNSFAPAIGEPLYVTDEQKLYIGDGVTEKGIGIGGATDLDQLTSVDLITEKVGSISSYSVTSNVATVTLELAKGYTEGLIVTIADTTVSALNATHTITAIPAANQFSFALTAADVANTSITGSVTPSIPDGDVLYWDNAAGKWENHTLSLTEFDEISFPTTPSNNQILKHNGTSFINTNFNIQSDSNPTLGGNLTVNGNDIVSASGGDINIAPDGTGDLIVKGNATGGSGKIKLNCENNSHGVTIQGPPHSAAATYTLTLPNNNGDAGQALITDGSGVLSFGTAAQQFSKWKYNLTAAPTQVLVNSNEVGLYVGLGSWSQVTNANYGTNGSFGPGTAGDPTLTGVTEDTFGTFSGFTNGLYRIDVSLDIIIAGLSNNSYNRYNHEIRVLNGTTQLPGVTQDFNFTCNATAPTGNTLQTVTMSLVVVLESTTTTDNKVRFILNSDQSNNYYCNSAVATFTKLS